MDALSVSPIKADLHDENFDIARMHLFDDSRAENLVHNARTHAKFALTHQSETDVLN